jgi:hypothetical protein
MTLRTRPTGPGLAAASQAPGHWLMLAVLLLGQFMCIIDG